ncbi:MAG: hypothetical protein IKB38_03705 [Clostridia bacterium]|nr:hypothetical protein [Clostridia bacterium]
MKLFKNIFIFLLAGIIGVIGGFSIAVGVVSYSGEYSKVNEYSKKSKAELKELSDLFASSGYSVSDISTDDEKHMIFLVSSGEKSIDISSANLNANVAVTYNSDGRSVEVRFIDKMSSESEANITISGYKGLLSLLDTFYDAKDFTKLLELFDASKLTYGSNSVYEISVPTDAYKNYRNSEAVTVRYELQKSDTGYSLLSSVSVQLPTES